MIHEDERRIIYDWAVGNFRSLKTVVVKEAINIGDHYHNNKDEHFLLVIGKFIELQLDDGVLYDLPAPYIVNVKRGTYHRFLCEPGSILMCGATEEFDQNDEIKGKNDSQHNKQSK